LKKYISPLMLLCIGVNIPVVALGVMMSSAELTILGFMSATLCLIGYLTHKDGNDE